MQVVSSAGHSFDIHHLRPFFTTTAGPMLYGFASGARANFAETFVPRRSLMMVSIKLLILRVRGEGNSYLRKLDVVCFV